jgi:hypothetical protein
MPFLTYELGVVLSSSVRAIYTPVIWMASPVSSLIPDISRAYGVERTCWKEKQTDWQRFNSMKV